MTVGDLTRRAAAKVPDLCLVTLRLSGWTAVTGLAAAGCLMLLFAALGQFTAAGFFAHLDNLASRFVTADPERRADFLRLARIAAAALVAIVSACRWRSFARCFDLAPGARA